MKTAVPGESRNGGGQTVASGVDGLPISAYPKGRGICKGILSKGKEVRMLGAGYLMLTKNTGRDLYFSGGGAIIYRDF